LRAGALISPLPAAARLIAALALLAALAGCAELQLGGDGEAADRPVPPRPPTRIEVDGIVIAGPQGYCVDRSASRAGRAGFVLMASCSAISQAPEHPAPGRKGLLTATVGASGSGAEPIDPELFGAYFRSAEGRAALSNTGEAEAVSVLGSRVSDGAFYVVFLDRSTPSQPDLGPARWRAIFTTRGRIVTAVLHSFLDDPISREAGFGLLQDFVERIQRQPGGAQATRAAQSPVDPALRD